MTSYMTRNWDPENNPRGLVIDPAEVVVPSTLWLAQQGRFVYGQGAAAERLRQDLAIGFLL